MATTNHLAIALLEQSQAQKDITVNEALARIDAILNTGVIDRTLTTPPAAPSEGDVYVIAAGASAEWSGKDDQLTYFDGAIWRYIVPKEGLTIWSSQDTALMHYDGAGWYVTTDSWKQFDQSQTFNLKTLTDASSIAWDVRFNQIARVTLSGSRTLANPTNAQAGGVYVLIVRQDATGGRNLSFGSAYKFAGGAAPVVSAAPNAIDIISFLYDGTHMLGNCAQNFS